MFDPSSRFLADSDLGGTDKVQEFMDGATEKFQHPKGGPGLSKIIKITITSGPKQIMKLASDSTLTEDQKLYAKTLADSYALYKISFLKTSHEIQNNFALDDIANLLLTCQDIVE